MRAQFRLSDLIPSELNVDEVRDAGDAIIVAAYGRSQDCTCPHCGTASRRVHSRYSRMIADLPCAGRRIELHLSVRRFVCSAVHCRRKIFAERFLDDVIRPMARRTARLDCLVRHLALALGGRPAARFADRLGLPVSNDTLLRTVRRYDRPPSTPPTVIGIDDWAWRRNHRYGTIICDLERRKTIALLPDREPSTAKAWLVEQPQIKTVARDRGGAYARAAAQALPQAEQFADRWHLMENASHAFLDAVRKSMRQVRIAVGTATVNSKLLTAAERLQYDGYLRREETNSVIRGLVGEGLSIKAIVRRTGHSRKLVRSIVRGQRTDIFRVRQTSLEPHLPWLEAQWDAGSRNGAELWRQLRLAGFGGGLRVVTEWATRRRRAEKAENGLGHAPAARTIVRLMTLERNNLTKAQTMTVAAIEEQLPDLVEARDVVESFHEMLRRKSKDDLDTWIDRAAASLVAPFGNGIIRDRAAVQNAITSQWSNGQTEGQITKLKLIKRQMYGRGKLDLLEARVIGAT
ncbi:ISL3 family transposase [Brucella intermedia]|uniref:ISL3 family transposase n=1 Tax=Brucella intermedia TaxID=94625 RepID=UPI00124E0B44|nr:ISL3 family transposase [Brucella intermedia]KAB2707518.1 ISL3 family transposase [Brucella intermedia]